MEFYEVVDAGDVAERVHTAKLDAAGAFKETVSIEGDQVRVIAIADRDGDGACTTGEFWGEATASIAEDDTVMPVALVLKDSDCPVTN